MPNVVRFTLSTARDLYVPGAGQFIDGVLDVDVNDLTLLSRTRYLVVPYGATEIGIVDSATPYPSLPAVPVPPPADPYPMYLDPSEIFDSETGQIRTDKLPDRLSETELRAAFGTAVIARDGIDFTTATDSTAALQAHIDSVPAGGTLILPADGSIRVDGPLSVPSNITIAGVGYRSAIDYRGAGPLFTLASKTNIEFRNLRVHLNNATAVGFDVSNTFRCTWTGVTVEGQHSAASGATYHALKGFILRDNAGDNRIIDCDLNNLGIAIQTDTIMNYMVGGVIGSCWRGIVGGDPAGTNFRAGMAVESTTFVGVIGGTDAHVLVTGSAAEWWLSHVHMEKCDRAIEVGVAAGGARSFSITDSFLAAKTTILNLRSVRQPHLESLTFSKEVGDTPIELVIDATDVPNGAAINLRSTQVFDFADSVFPVGWFVYRRGVLRLPSAVNGNLALAGKQVITPTSDGDIPLTVEGRSGTTADLFQIKRGGTVYAALSRFNVWTMGTINATGKVTSTQALRPGNGTAAGVNIWSGSGAPTIAGALGDRYIRTDTPDVSMQREYVCTTAGAAGVAVWTAIL